MTFFVLAQGLLIGAIVYMVQSYFWQMDNEEHMKVENNEKRLNRIEQIMKEKGDLDTRAPWNR